MPFDYYRRLSKKAQATYRRSDAIGQVTLGELARLRPKVAALAHGLETEQRAQVGRAAQALADELCRQLDIRPARVRVLSRRPLEPDGGELYGRCTWETDDAPPVIEIWMRTHKKMRVVAFKTFLRTLVHELCHHLDYELHGLDDTFHTEGFFKRESSLVRQLLDAAPDLVPAPKPKAKPAPKAKAKPKPAAKPKPKPKPRAESAPEPEPDAPPPKSQLDLPW